MGRRGRRSSRRSRWRARRTSRCSCGSATRTVAAATSTAAIAWYAQGAAARAVVEPARVRDRAGAVRRRPARRGESRLYELTEVRRRPRRGRGGARRDRARPGPRRRRGVVPAARGARLAAQRGGAARADRGGAGAPGSRRRRAQQLEPALAAWPDDGALHYLSGVAHAMAGEREPARSELAAARGGRVRRGARRDRLARRDGHGRRCSSGRSSRGRGATPRRWRGARPLRGDAGGDGERARGVSGVAARDARRGRRGAEGAAAAGRAPRVPDRARSRRCGRPAQQQLARYERLGVDLEADARFSMRHDEAGETRGAAAEPAAGGARR